MKNLRKVRAFTLIELIVVIVIIGILLALAAVGYLSFVQNSNKKSSFATAKQAATIVQGASATSQDKAPAAAIAVGSADFVKDGLVVGGTAGTDGVVMYTASAAVGSVAAGDLVICGIKGGQRSAIVFSNASAAGSGPSYSYDASTNAAMPGTTSVSANMAALCGTGTTAKTATPTSAVMGS